MTDLGDLAITRFPTRPLAPRIWELRHTLTAYDAAYIALSEATNLALVTCDARLSRAIGHAAEILLID